MPLEQVKSWKVKPSSLPTDDLTFDDIRDLNQIKRFIHQKYGQYRRSEESFVYRGSTRYALFICRVIDRYVSIAYNPWH